MKSSYEIYCRECLEELFEFCEGCDNWFIREDLRKGADDDLYCDDCFGAHFYVCDGCNAVIDQDDAEAIVCSAKLTRDIDDQPVALNEFEKTLTPRKTIIFSGLFEPIQLSEDQLEEHATLWEEMKPKILHRTMCE